MPPTMWMPPKLALGRKKAMSSSSYNMHSGTSLQRGRSQTSDMNARVLRGRSHRKVIDMGHQKNGMSTYSQSKLETNFSHGFIETSNHGKKFKIIGTSVGCALHIIVMHQGTRTIFMEIHKFLNRERNLEFLNRRT